MTRLFNAPADFADELLDGFAAAKARWVLKVPGGGVVRATEPASPTVALVIGGGSGHYPAFGGLVGPGLAHGAAMGNLFASPSAHQVHSVARAAEAGRGVLLCYGNYAGDVLHFDRAQEQLRREGIDCRTVVVTDDVSSASVGERAKRRGIAGDLTVFKVAGAAAEAGLDLDEVERVARLANDRTRSFGVAFSGCTLPGAAEPLFTVPEGRMALGLGIHGEPGIGETDVPTADGLAALLVEQLLAEVPDGIGGVAGARVVPILNGLGSVKYEELFVVYRSVAARLAAVGLVIVEPEVGELVTSFDMAGASLTLLWLDDELERLWGAPADTPAYAKGAVPAATRRSAASFAEQVEASIPTSSEASRAAATVAADAIAAITGTVDDAAERLGHLDAIAGDGDHGIGMQRGSTAALAAARAAQGRGAGAGTLLALAGDAWAHRAGGTSGALWGTILRTIGERLGDEAAPDAEAIAAGLIAADRAVQDFGKAQVGDKTMVDALVPFAETLAARVAEGASLVDAWMVAAEAATAAAEATSELLPRMGRARPHAEKSLGTPDAGATSLALITTTVGRVLAARRLRRPPCPNPCASSSDRTTPASTTRRSSSTTSRRTAGS